MGLKKLICIILFIPLLACSGKVTKEESLESLFELGLNYLRGNDSLGIYMNKEKGIALIRRSAEQGNAEAQYCLGDCYANGEGVTMHKRYYGDVRLLNRGLQKHNLC